MACIKEALKSFSWLGVAFCFYVCVCVLCSHLNTFKSGHCYTFIHSSTSWFSTVHVNNTYTYTLYITADQFPF